VKYSTQVQKGAQSKKISVGVSKILQER